MTDCNANQLVVKAHVEGKRAHPMQDQQVVADQPMATQIALNAPNTGADQQKRTQDPVESQTPAVGLSTPAPSLSLEADKPIANPLYAMALPAQLEEALCSLADQHPAIQLEKQRHIQVSPTVCVSSDETSPGGASLSNLDRVGMGVRITRTMRATSVHVEGGQPSTSGSPATQTISTHQEIQELLMCTDVGEVDILDLDVDGSEDFSDIDLDLADELLGESLEEMIGNWVAKCNRDVTSGLDQGTQPDLESDFRDLELADGWTPEATTRAASSVTNVPAAPLPSAVSTMDTTEGRPTTIAAQPGLSIHRHTFWIDGMGEFNRDDGQPISLNA